MAADRTIRPPMPPDHQVLRALVESGMSPGQAASLLSPLRRLISLDFGNRWRHKLLKAAMERVAAVRTKNSLLETLRKAEKEEKSSLGVEALAKGDYYHDRSRSGRQRVLQAINELVAEQTLIRFSRGGVQMVGLTGKEPRFSGAALREVVEQIKRAMGFKGQQKYYLPPDLDL